MDEGQRTQASIKEEVSESRKREKKKKDSRGGNTLITCVDDKKTRRRVAREDLNGPRTKSEEPNHRGCHAVRLKLSNPTPFFYRNSPKIETGASPRAQSPAFQAYSLQIIL